MRRSTFLLIACCIPAMAMGAPLHLDRIKLPPGFHISVYAENVPNAREMALSPGGVLFVSTRRAGNVYAVMDTEHRNRGDRVITIARGLENPNGVAFRNGALFVAERSRVLRYDDIERHLDSPPKPVVIRDDFPHEAHHGWKFIAFGPDGWLYVPVGAPCNICKSPEIYATITRISPDGKQREIFAHGVRNTVGFDWHPQTNVLWFTDNGRDDLGEDTPPDELDAAPKAGMHFGFPYCHGTKIPDPEFGKERPCSSLTPPVANLEPHVAALGTRFYTGSMFPAEYKNNIFIAEHGSWNRHKYQGARIKRVIVDPDGKNAKQEIFASGWLEGDQGYLGRPADIVLAKDGSLLVADDWAGAIYRISYNKK